MCLAIFYCLWLNTERVSVYDDGPPITGPNGKGVGVCQAAGLEDAVIWYSAPAASGPAHLSPADATEIPFDTSILAIPTDGLPTDVTSEGVPPITATLYYITSSSTTLFVPGTPCPFTYSWDAGRGECLYNPCPVGQWYGDSTGCLSIAPDAPGMRWSYPGYPPVVMAMTTDASTSSASESATTTTTSTIQSTTQTSETTSAATIAPISVPQSAASTGYFYPNLTTTTTTTATMSKHICFWNFIDLTDHYSN